MTVYECCRECVRVHSTVPGKPLNTSCSVFISGYDHLPYKLSNGCKNYFLNNSLTIGACTAIYTNHGNDNETNDEDETENHSNDNQHQYRYRRTFHNEEKIFGLW
jgi:hypothetical protein